MYLRTLVFKRLEKLEDDIKSLKDMAGQRLDGFLEGMNCTMYALDDVIPKKSFAVEEQHLKVLLEIAKNYRETAFDFYNEENPDYECQVVAAINSTEKAMED